MEKLVWLLVFTIGYWSYCIFWGIKGARQTKTASDYFIAGRGIGLWVFVLAATATSFSGWTFVGHPGTIYNVGLPYAFASFYAITIPLTGVLFLKRRWPGIPSFANTSMLRQTPARLPWSRYDQRRTSWCWGWGPAFRSRRRERPDRGRRTRCWG